MKNQFTIEEIKKYILSQDSLGDVMHYLSAGNIIKANQSKDFDQYDFEEWFEQKFEELSEEHSNGELIDAIDIVDDGDGIIALKFDIDLGRDGIRRGNVVVINSTENELVRLTLDESIEGGDLDVELKSAILDYLENGK